MFVSPVARIVSMQRQLWVEAEVGSEVVDLCVGKLQKELDAAVVVLCKRWRLEKAVETADAE